MSSASTPVQPGGGAGTHPVVSRLLVGRRLIRSPFGSGSGSGQESFSRSASSAARPRRDDGDAESWRRVTYSSGGPQPAVGPTIPFPLIPRAPPSRRPGRSGFPSGRSRRLPAARGSRAARCGRRRLVDRVDLEPVARAGLDVTAASFGRATTLGLLHLSLGRKATWLLSVLKFAVEEFGMASPASVRFPRAKCSLIPVGTRPSGW